MSTLREAAEEALRWMEHARLHLTIKERMHPDGLHLYDSAAEALRAALAQPEAEAEAEPVAWRVRWIDPEEGPGDWVPTRDPDFYRSRPTYEVRPLYAHPPRDEWRPASEPPEDLRRRVIAWRSPPQRQSGTWVEALYDDGAWVTRDGIAHDITHWRDVTPPTEGK